MKPHRRFEPGTRSADQLVSSLDGPSRTITVEPIVLPVPVPAPRIEPDPKREPAKREPDRPPEPAR
jgi:hypothetical protein